MICLVAPPTPTFNNIAPTSDVSAVSESIISSSTPTDDDLVIFTVALTLCAVVTCAALILIAHIIKKRRRIPQTRKGISPFSLLLLDWYPFLFTNPFVTSTDSYMYSSFYAGNHVIIITLCNIL